MLYTFFFFFLHKIEILLQLNLSVCVCKAPPWKLEPRFLLPCPTSIYTCKVITVCMVVYCILIWSNYYIMSYVVVKKKPTYIQGSFALNMIKWTHIHVGFFLLLYNSLCSNYCILIRSKTFPKKNGTWINEDYQPHVGLFSSYPYSKLLVTKHV